MSSLSRRVFLTAALLPVATIAHAQAPLAFSSIAVDVSHLREIGSGPFADIAQGAMTDELRHAFADRIGGRGPRLVVRVTGLFLTSLPEGGGRFHHGGGGSTSTDSM